MPLAPRALTTAALAGASALLGVVPAAGAPPVRAAVASAPAATVCSIAAPRAVAVARRTTRISLRLAVDCPVGAWATWDLLGPRGERLQRVSLTQGTSGTFVITPRHPYGTYRLDPVTAYAHDFGQIPQNHATFTVGARSRTVTGSARSGASVRVAATASTYDHRGDAFRARPKARVELQRAACARGCAWTTVARSATDASGQVTLTATSARPVTWRTVVAGTPTARGSVSPPFMR